MSQRGNEVGKIVQKFRHVWGNRAEKPFMSVILLILNEHLSKEDPETQSKSPIEILESISDQEVDKILDRIISSKK